MLPSTDKLYGAADFIFQQDLAPAHTAKGTKSWFNDHGVTVLDWPANSPDMNHIENQEEDERYQTQQCRWPEVGSRGLMDRALDLETGVTQGCGFESRQEVRKCLEGSVHDWGETLEQGEPPTAPRAPQCRLPTAPLGWVKLLIILCIIVYLTNKAHLIWRPQSKQPGLPLQLSSSTNWSRHIDAVIHAKGGPNKGASKYWVHWN